MNRVPTWVGIPYTDREELTAPLVAALLEDPQVDQVLLWDNGSTSQATLEWELSLATGGTRVQVRRRPRLGELHAGRRWSLYGAWNGTWDEALAATEGAPVNVVLLNNDLTVPPRFVSHLTAALRSSPEHVWITYPNAARPLGRGVDPDAPVTPTRGLWPAGMTGFALALAGEAPIPRVDERFIFYCGDVDLIWQTQLAGGTAARVEGLPVHHALGATRKAGNWWDQIAADRALREAKYPQGVPRRRP